jgi:hypothetical protein
MTHTIQQGEWIHIPTAMRPDNFLKYIGEMIGAKVPEVYESTLHMWLEEDQRGYPAIRLQWERPMTKSEVERLYGQETKEKATRRKQYEELKKEFENE